MLTQEAIKNIEGLTDTQKQIYIVAKAKAMKDIDDQEFITVNHIYYSNNSCRHLCMCIETVRRALNKLSELGILHKKSNPGWCTIYYIY